MAVVDGGCKRAMGVQVTWLSRASWFKITTADGVIQIDPGYAGYLENSGVPVAQVERADLVLVTHCHKDHLQPPALEMIRDGRTRVCAPRTCRERIGGDVTTVKPGDELELGRVRVSVVDAYNTPAGSSTRKVHHQGDGVGYLLTVEGQRLYHAGDTDFIPPMKQLGHVDLALLPIGGKFTMDLAEAVTATLAINPRVVIPMHRSDADPEVFRERVQAASRVQVVNLAVGQAFQLA